MSSYTATATREGHWWVIDVQGVGVTQARSKAEAHEMVADLIRGLVEDPDPQFTIDFA